MVGDTPTIADFSLAGYVFYPVEEHGYDWAKSHPNIHAWTRAPARAARLEGPLRADARRAHQAAQVSAPDTSPRLLAIGGLIAMAAAVGIGRFIYTPILPLMAEGLHLTKGEAGLIASANFVGYLAGAVAAASPRLRGNPRTWLLAALAISAVTTGAMAWPAAWRRFSLLRFMGGVASAYVLVLASSLVLERLAASGHGGLSAVHFSGVGTGIVVSALLTWALALGRVGLARDVGRRRHAVACRLRRRCRSSFPEDAARPSAGDAAAGSAARRAARGGSRSPMACSASAMSSRRPSSSSSCAARRRPLRSSRYSGWFGLAAIPSVALWAAAGRRHGVLRSFAAACIIEAAGVFASVAWPGVAGGCSSLGAARRHLHGVDGTRPDRRAQSRPRRCASMARRS